MTFSHIFWLQSESFDNLLVKIRLKIEKLNLFQENDDFVEKEQATTIIDDNIAFIVIPELCNRAAKSYL